MRRSFAIGSRGKDVEPIEIPPLLVMGNKDKVNIYSTADEEEAGKPVINVTKKAQDKGKRMIFTSIEDWVEVEETGTFADSDRTKLGIFTRGQSICIGITLINLREGTFRMAHVSSSKSPLISKEDSEFYIGYTEVDASDLYAVITSKATININEVIGYLKQNLPKKLNDEHIWWYSVKTAFDSISSAVDCNGFFGEV